MKKQSLKKTVYSIWWNYVEDFLGSLKNAVQYKICVKNQMQEAVLLRLCHALVWWMLAMVLVGVFLIYSGGSHFFRIGPGFSLLGIYIDTSAKYILVIVCSALNTVFRTIQHEMLNPWIVTHVQDISRIKTHFVKKHAYNIAFVNTLYQWVDFLIYTNILLSQADLVCIEIALNIIATLVVTHVYISNEPYSEIYLSA